MKISRIALCLFSLVVAAGLLRADPAPKPNIIVIFMDDLGYNDVGVQTYPKPPNQYPVSGPTPQLGANTDPDIPAPNKALGLTPSIDSLAAQGLTMSSFHSTRLCSPSRASLLTGRYDRRVNITAVFFPNSNGPSGGLSTREVTLPEILRGAGYSTGMIGKWHLGYKPGEAIPFQMMPTRHGFQEFFGSPHSNDMPNFDLIQNETIVEPHFASAQKQAELTWRYTESALDFIQRNAADEKPFFLYFAHIMTHIPCWPSDREFTNADGTIWPKFQGTSGVSYYYDVVKEVDHSVGRILAKLNSLGISDDTLVIFTSDNGPWLSLSNINLTDRSVGSAYPLKDGKFTTWEGGVRVPMFARWPGHIPAGSTTGQVGGLVDLLPTLAGLGGGAVPADRTIDGVNLWPLWSGSVQTLDRSYAFYSSQTLEAVVKDGWKLRSGQLFDLQNDIQELTNVAGVPANAATLASLEAERSSIIASINAENEPRGEFSAWEVELSTLDVPVPEGGTATINVRLSANPVTSVTVSTARFSGDADLSVSAGGNLTFDSSNWSTWQTVTLAAAQDADADAGVATFRVTNSGFNVVREVFATESDDEAGPVVSASLVWPKVGPAAIAGTAVTLAAEASALVGGQSNPEGTIYSWTKVSGPGQVTFTDPGDKETGVNFSAVGVYLLRLTANHPTAAGPGSIEFAVHVGLTTTVPLPFSPIAAYDATADTDGDSIWGNLVSPGARDITLSPSVTKSSTGPGTPETLLHFGVDADINGAAAGGEGAGIAGNGTAPLFSFSAPNVLNPRLTLEAGSVPAATRIQLASGLSIGGGGQQTNDVSYIGHDQTTLAGAISNNDFIFFRVTVQPGWQLNLSGYQFEIWRNGGQAVENYGIAHGVSGFTANSASPDATKTITSTGLGAIGTLNGSTSSLQSVGASVAGAYTGTVEFRLYGWQGATGTSVGNTHFDAARVFGTVTEITDPAPGLSFIDSAWDFPGGTTMLGGVSENFASFSTGSASFEFWFKPDSLPTATQQVLWETGGDTGVSFILNGSQLRFVVDDGAANAINGATATATLVPAPARDGFIHAIGVIDLAGDQIRLYLDGILADSQPIPTVMNWCDTSLTGLGKIGDAPDGTDGSAVFNLLGGNDQLSPPVQAFAGLVAIVRFYNKALLESQVAALSTGAVMSNIGPTVSAGPDQNIAFYAGTTLTGTVADDGQPGGVTLATLWRAIDGPGATTLGNASLPVTTVAFDQSGDYRLRFAADDTEVKVFDEMQVSVAPPTYAQWEIAAGLAPADRGFGVDPDDDHLTNGLEAWFGTDPGEFSTGLAILSLEGTTATFTHPRSLNPPSDLSSFYQWSPNLVDWYAGDGVQGPPGGPKMIVSANSSGTTTTVTVTASGTTERFFLRTGVLQN